MSQPDITPDAARAVETTRDAILHHGIILCLRAASSDGAVEACRAAARGGIRLFEITLTTPDAVAIMRTLAEDRELLVGAGTVLTAAQFGMVAEAGARFVMSPVFDPEVVSLAASRGILAIPGAATPLEILTAHRHGAKLVKIYPSGTLGGPDYLRYLRGPLPGIPLVPTSGPASSNFREYVEAGAVAVGIGAEVFAPGATPELIEANAARAVAAMRAARS